MLLSFINIPKVPKEVLKTFGFALGFQHFPRDLELMNGKTCLIPLFNTAINLKDCFTSTCAKLKFLKMPK